MLFFPMNDTPLNSDSKEGNEPTPDPRVVAALEEQGVTYEIKTCEDSADCVVLVGFDDNRNHRVVINSNTKDFMGVEMRSISSIALVSEGPFDARTANLLLRENATVEFGSWQILADSDNTHIAIFSVTIGASIRSKSLVDLICMVARIADSTEDRLSGLDEF
jgi:hypothetical protein